MRGLTSSRLRSLGARRGRTLLSVVGIALGVGVLFASLATDAGIEAAIDRTVHDIVGRADLRVAAFGEEGLSRRAWPRSTRRPGVVVAAPVLERRTYLVPDGSTPDGLEQPVTMLGIDPAAEVADPRPAARRGRAHSPGRRRSGRSSPSGSPPRTGSAVGSNVTFQGGTDGPVSLTVEGILAGDGPFVGSGGRTVVVPLRTAQAAARVRRRQPRRHRRRRGRHPGRGQLGARGRADRASRTCCPSPRDLAASLRSSTADFRAMTALIAAVSLFVGAFLIFNTLSMTVTERIRELGLLRAAGATRGQLARFVLVQAAVLAVLGSVLGLAAGAGPRAS